MSGLAWGAMALCWLGFLALGAANWGMGGPRALLLTGFAAVPAYLLVSRRSRGGGEPIHAGTRPKLSMVLALVALALVHLAWFAASWFDPHPRFVDIGLTTLAAAHAILHGMDPYTLPIDPQSLGALKGFDGYKYTPVMALAYMPLGAILGTRGLLLTNLLADLGVTVLVGRLATRMGGRAAGWMATMLYLSLPLVPHQLFGAGVTDLIPVLALLVGLAFNGRSAALSGFFMGLSVAAKPFPGLIAAAYGLSKTERFHYLAGCAVGLAPIAVFLAHSGRSLIDNTLLFNLARPPDSTAWLSGQPVPVVILIRIAALTVLLAGTAIIWRRDASLYVRSCWTIVGVIVSILAGAAAHTNYILWWLPLFCSVISSVFGDAAVLPDACASPTRTGVAKATQIAAASA